MKRDEFYRMLVTTTIGVLPLVLAFAAVRGDFKMTVVGSILLAQAIGVGATLGLSFAAK